MATRRQERIGQLIVREVAEALRDIKDPRFGFVTVTGCEISPDLRHANVRLSVMGEDAQKEVSLALAQRQAPAMRGRVARALSLRVAPTLHFTLDNSAAEAAEISRLIREARASDPNPGDRPEPAVESGDARETVAEAAAPAAEGLSPAVLRIIRCNDDAEVGGVELVERYFGGDGDGDADDYADTLFDGDEGDFDDDEDDDEDGDDGEALSPAFMVKLQEYLDGLDDGKDDGENDGDDGDGEEDGEDGEDDD